MSTPSSESGFLKFMYGRGYSQRRGWHWALWRLTWVDGVVSGLFVLACVLMFFGQNLFGVWFLALLGRAIYKGIAAILNRIRRHSDHQKAA